MSNKKCLIVLGMHRSGTSALAGVLQLLNVNLGKDLIASEVTNPKGFFENTNIYNANERLLKSLRSSWEAPLLLPENWWLQENLSIHKNSIIELLQTEFKDSKLFGIKDPRMCLLLPFWQQIFRELRITPYYLIILRNPLEVATSLVRREHFSYEKSLTLWMNSMLYAERYSRNHPRIFIAFEKLLHNPQKTITSISNILSVKFPKSFQEVESAIHKFLTPGLKHYSFENHKLDDTALPLISEYYQILQNLTDNYDDQEKEFAHIDKLREKYYHLANWFYNEDIRRKLETFYYEDSEYSFKELSALVFIDTGSGFHTEQSIIKKIAGDENLLEFDLKDYSGIKRIKFCPLNKMVILNLHKIEIMTAANILNNNINYSTNALYRQDNLLVFETNTPEICIDITGKNTLKTLVIQLEYLAWETDKYQYLMMSKDAKISEQTRCIQTMENTLSWRMTSSLRQVRNNPRFARFYSLFFKILGIKI